MVKGTKCLCSKLGLALYQLCDTEQVICLLWASISSSVKWGDNNSNSRFRILVISNDFKVFRIVPGQKYILIKYELLLLWLTAVRVSFKIPEINSVTHFKINQFYSTADKVLRAMFSTCCFLFISRSTPIHTRVLKCKSCTLEFLKLCTRFPWAWDVLTLLVYHGNSYSFLKSPRSFMTSGYFLPPLTRKKVTNFYTTSVPYIYICVNICMCDIYTHT